MWRRLLELAIAWTAIRLLEPLRGHEGQDSRPGSVDLVSAPLGEPAAHSFGFSSLGIAIVSILTLGGICILGSQVLQDRAQVRAVAKALTQGDARRAPPLMVRYGCAGCHTIPDVPGSDGKVGPPLAGFRQRVYIAGVALNDPKTLVLWIVNPQQIVPQAAMPATGVAEQEARDIAAWLYEH